jgi:hypothetical protein
VKDRFAEIDTDGANFHGIILLHKSSTPRINLSSGGGPSH